MRSFITTARLRLLRSRLRKCRATSMPACSSVASVAARLGHRQVEDRLLTRAAALKRSFERDFWLDREGMIALAVDADGQPCRVMTSNGAHCLATGLVDGDRATAMCRRLLADDMYSGWGIRTLSRNEQRYNPMSYHNGSVWPHDNAMAALGLARAGDHAGVLKVLEGLFDASEQLNTSSLPELFCGFRRETGLGSGAISGRVLSASVVGGERLHDPAGDAWDARARIRAPRRFRHALDSIVAGLAQHRRAARSATAASRSCCGAPRTAPRSK